MTGGRRTVFTIYDEEVYKKLKMYLVETDQELSHYVWSLIMQDQSKIEAESEKSSLTSRISDFAPNFPPPRLIEDFDHVIRPYLNKHANIEELKLIEDNAHKVKIYSQYMYLALNKNLLKNESRKLRDITFDEASDGLEWINRVGVSH